MSKDAKEQVNFKALSICLVIGLILWFLPAPGGMNPDGWKLLAIFISTIIAIVIRPLPMGAVALISMTICIITNKIQVGTALKGFSNNVVWLVVMAFFIAKGFVVTGFGNRIGYFFTGLLGKKTLGLSYGLAITDLFMAPAVPSVTARSAGIVYPIVQSIARSYDSYPHDKSANKIGSFLTVTSFQINVITSAMFMTAMAANPLLANYSLQHGLFVSWMDWLVASCVPGIISIILIPFIIYKTYPPEITHTPNAAEIAKQHLQDMGKIKRPEWIMCSTIGVLLALWVFGGSFGVAPVTAAMIGLSILLLTGVLSWKVLLKEADAWETFFWFCVLLMLTKELDNYHVISWFADQSSHMFVGLNWKVAFPILGLLYFYSHYFFASATAHVSAMYVPFLLVSISFGTPPMLAAYTLIFFSNLFGGLTHYTFSPAPLLYGVGYVKLNDWWKIGFIISIVNIIIWSVIGSCWWKLLHIW
jgi:divalent anion:Na+ symporter, DASS family